MRLDTHITHERRDVNPVVNEHRIQLSLLFSLSFGEKLYKYANKTWQIWVRPLFFAPCSNPHGAQDASDSLLIPSLEYIPSLSTLLSLHKGNAMSFPSTLPSTKEVSCMLLFTNAASSKLNTKHLYSISLVTLSGLTFYKRRNYTSIEWQVYMTSDSFHLYFKLL